MTDKLSLSDLDIDPQTKIAILTAEANQWLQLRFTLHSRHKVNLKLKSPQSVMDEIVKQLEQCEMALATIDEDIVALTGDRT